MNKLNYTCKKCGWKTSIRTEWADLKPKRCSGKKGSKVCGVNFQKEPDMLLIEAPEVPKVKEKKEKEHGRKERSIRSQEAQS